MMIRPGHHFVATCLVPLFCSAACSGEDSANPSGRASAPMAPGPEVTSPPAVAPPPATTNAPAPPTTTAPEPAPAEPSTSPNEPGVAPEPSGPEPADTQSPEPAEVPNTEPMPTGPVPAEPMPTEPMPTDAQELPVLPYMLGADISFVQEEEDKGIVFTDAGFEKDMLQILKDHGFNFIRLRLFHDPGAPGGYQNEFVTRAEPYCDLEHTLEMAQRVEAAGMGLLLDFHYSDTWADPADQLKPAAWESLAFEDLRTTVYEYTRDTLLAFESAGALPEMVQVGNEITPGMLRPDGATYDPDNWDQLAELLTAGLTAVKDVDPSIYTMLHIDRGGDNETTVWWVGEAMSRGVEFDVLGQSAYSAFHGGPADWEANFVDTATRYPDLRFAIAEYNGEKRAVNDIMRNLPDGRGMGTFFWEPTANGEWGDAMVTWAGSQAQMKPEDLAIYDQIADDYGLR